MSAPEQIRRLVERFEENLESYKRGAYNETLVRRDFLDPMFTALGWDMDNSQGLSEAFRDVVHGTSIKVGKTTKLPDYGFRIGGKQIFFLEAKKPAVYIKEEAPPAYQLRRYAWSAGMPLSVLSDFEEFAIYDTRIKPSPSDKPSKARLLYLTFRDYIDKWDEIASIFSKDAILRGSFERLSVKKKGRGVEPVDEAFLGQMEEWRLVLARNIALRNVGIGIAELNYAVQATIDRIVFLRICEDRGIEKVGRLGDLADDDDIYKNLGGLFRLADSRYNSGLFHFANERFRSSQRDTLTLGLTIDDQVLRGILKGLYYPESPYEFSVLPADILGQTYERFLGKVIRLTAGGKAKVEEKPEVKKAGGVYYTPTYIVEYIVKQTVGHLLNECKDPKEVAKLNILDPACGSGSFLIVAYQCLLDWHLNWYTEHGPEKYSRGKSTTMYQAQDGWRLTIAERKRILLNNIYGVDIDSQAVEVTKLSLALKVLESESDETLNQQLQTRSERALPDLDGNIKCGNSLIGPDFFDGRLDLDEEERRRINAFDWQAEFPQVPPPHLKGGGQGGFQGGFDAVIGNPPYVSIQNMKQWAPLEVEFCKQRYAAGKGSYDIYAVFVERGMDLLNKRGHFGFILPNKFFRTDYGAGLRKLLADERAVRRIVDFGHSQVFGATTYTCLLFLGKAGQDTFEYAASDASPEGLVRAPFKKMPAVGLTEQAWAFEDGQNASILTKLEQNTIRLLDLPADMSRGSSSGDDEVFVLDNRTPGIENEILREPLFASDFGRYHFGPAGKWKIIFPYVPDGEKFRLLAESDLKRHFSGAYKYLLEHQTALKSRKQFKSWYGFSAPRSLALHDRSQIAVPLLANRGLFALIPDEYKGRLCPMASGGFTIALAEKCPLMVEYVLGLLNSRLLFWRLQGLSNVFRGGWVTCTKQYFGELPIRLIDFSDKQDRARHQKMVALVEQMLKLHRDLTTAKTAHDKTLIERQIAVTDKQIDKLVYELYGLSEEEIAIVERKTSDG